MSRRGWHGRVRSGILTTGAVAGVLSVLWTVGLGLAGLTPLVFMSGSMAPAMEVGDVGLARTVPAVDVVPGDIVSVTMSNGVRVTHRVVSATPDGEMTRFRLKGDANLSVDEEAYSLATIDLVVGRVPAIGHVLTAAATPWGTALGATLLATCLVIGLGGPPSGTAHRRAERWPVLRRRRVLVPVVLLMVPVLWLSAATVPARGTLAYFSDNPRLSTPEDGVAYAPWFMCEHSTSQAAYGSKPWQHLNLNDNTGAPQVSASFPYFQDDTPGDWDGIYFVGGTSLAVTPDVNHGQPCYRDSSSRSVYLQGDTLATTEYIRTLKSATTASGVPGARWNTFTVNVWYRTNVGTGDDLGGVLAAFSQSGGTVMRPTDRVLYLGSDGRVRFYVDNGSPRYRQTSGNYADNKWHMATATLGPNGMCLYLDARIAGSCDASVTTGLQSEASTFWRFGFANLDAGITGMTDGNIGHRAFKGYLDDVAIWTRVLTADEIHDMYRAGLPIN